MNDFDNKLLNQENDKVYSLLADLNSTLDLYYEKEIIQDFVSQDQ
tara:strand:+ start:176 stop:310 length:135 start_codon:yes stop_codon:yes gene_type:complete